MRRPLASCVLTAVLLAALPALPATAGQAIESSSFAGFWASLGEVFARFFDSSEATTGPTWDPDGLQAPPGGTGPTWDPNGASANGDTGPTWDPNG